MTPTEEDVKAIMKRSLRWEMETRQAGNEIVCNRDLEPCNASQAAHDRMELCSYVAHLHELLEDLLGMPLAEWKRKVGT